jgi:dTDP-4-amino-4,6-dideoxygalactose transaminase/RimJ/RimL family protein N-acetyltransferase
MIPVFKPAIGSDTIKAAAEALDMGWLGMGSYVRDFEAALTRYLELPDQRRLVAVNTCTSALHLALEVAGVGAGDEVITPALNNIGDLQAIGMCGASPVFVDIRDHDMGVDAEKIEPLIGPRTKAIIAVHYMGVPCDIPAVFDVAKRHGLRVVEDAAHAIGTRWRGQRVGSYGDLVCFSFDAIKTLTCIDGGAVVTASVEEAERLYPARLLGMTQPNERLYANSRAYRYDVAGQGYRYHLANLHAAIGLSQLAKLPEFIANRRRYCRHYNKMLSDVPEVITPRTDFAESSMFHYVIRVTGGQREALAEHLKAWGVDTGIHWLPAHRFSRFRECRGADHLPVTDRVGDEILTLPLWSYMDDVVLCTVANAIRSFYGRIAVDGDGRGYAGVQLLRHAKLHKHRLSIEGFSGVALRAVRAEDPTEADVARLTEWRNQHVRSFLTEFEATPDRTRGWLARVATDDTRILFMVEEQNRAIGYVGLAFIDWDLGSAEADAVVRGESSQRGAMTAALRRVFQWARRELGIKRLGVRVLSDNPALAFYESFGFQEVRREALQRVVRTDCIAWEPVGKTDVPQGVRWLVHMEVRG